MINQSSNSVLVRIPMEKAKWNGKDVLRPAHGFSWAEFDDGEAHPISCPFEDWVISILNQGKAAGASAVGTIFFQFEAAGERSNDGQDTKETSVNNTSTIA